MQEHRYRISTKFNIHKAVLALVVLLGIIRLLVDIYDGELREGGLPGEMLAIAIPGLMLAALFCYRVEVHYNDIEQVVYKVDLRKNTEEAIPVSRITSVEFSGIGRDNWWIHYMDEQGRPRKFLLFTIPFDDSLETVIRDAQFVNPDLHVKRWNTGFW